MSESKQQLYIHSSENVNWVTTEFQGFKQENWIRASLRISEAFQGKKKKIILGPFKRISFPNCMDLTWINPIPGSFVSAPHWCDRWTGWSEGFSVGQVVLQSELKRASPPPPLLFLSCTSSSIMSARADAGAFTKPPWRAPPLLLLCLLLHQPFLLSPAEGTHQWPLSHRRNPNCTLSNRGFFFF